MKCYKEDYVSVQFFSQSAILQRTTVGTGQMKIQGVATCQYLCMASCGLLYGSREFGDECVFNETIEQSNYNTYASSKYSNKKRTYYLALNRRGQPRKVLLRTHNQLGKLSSYTRVLTRSVGPELQLYPMRRHHGHVCPNLVAHQGQKTHPYHQRCPKRKKRKKKKRRCHGAETEFCQKRHTAQNRNTHKCGDDGDSEVCQRDVNVKKKQKINNSEMLGSDSKNKRKNKKMIRKRVDQIDETTTTTFSPISTTPPEDSTPDEDYGGDASTHAEWVDFTGVPDIPMAVSDVKQTAPLHRDSD